MTLNDLLGNIETNLELILPNIDMVSIVPSGKGHQIRYFQKTGENKNKTWPVDFEQLPSGTKNFSALILDLLLRFSEQQDDVADIADYVGIVLIDEIDLHLHPKMQKEIIVQLAEEPLKIKLPLH
ncbi:MAG: ATP-binding protein [Chitinophagaceae bacterium]|nr:MAG: ATP-binding protein [Chitinophagaceae bacterium]